MRALFVDLDCILKVENKAWIVDKFKPNIPIMKINKEDFNLYKSGIYKSQGNKIDFNGKTFWLPDTVFAKLKVKLKNNDSRLSSLAISLQEFMNKELIENLPHEIDENIFSMLKNRVEDIYVVSSKQTKKNYQHLIDKLDQELHDKAITIKNYYYISETFYNQDDDEINFKKGRLFIQHLVGFKTDDKKFIDEELNRYDEIMVIDNNRNILSLREELNKMLKLLLSNTNESLSRVIRENIDDFKPKLELNLITDNNINRIIKEKITLDYSNIIRNFENFQISKNYLFLR